MDDYTFLELLSALETRVRYIAAAGGVVACPLCGQGITYEGWRAGLEPRHLSDCQWLAARRLLGLPERIGDRD
jgi:hypothetical protein